MTGTRLVELHAYAKEHTDDNPFLVANEYVAHRIGSRLGLPLPPGGLIGDTHMQGFATLAFRKGGANAPPVVPDQLVDEDPGLAAGVVVLDILIMNTDRHAGNLAFGAITQRLEIFDHSHAVFGHRDTAEAAEKAMQRMSTALAIDGVEDGQQVRSPHCLMDELLDAEPLLAWCDEAQRVLTDRFLGHLCDEVVAAGLLPERRLGRVLKDVLRVRRRSLRTIVDVSKSQFLGIHPSTWPLV